MARSSYKNKFDRGLYTLGIIAVYRLASYIPIPGLDLAVISQFYNNNSSILGIFNNISGGSVARMSIMSLNLMPYVSASIIMQLLTAVIPEWRELKKDSFQRRKINRYSRVLALGISLVQATGILIGLENLPGLVLQHGLLFKITTILSIVSSSLVVMWLSERISERGIGNGSSIIIFTGITCTAVPAGIAFIRNFLTGKCGLEIFLFSLALLLLFSGVIIFCESVRYLVPIFFKKSVLSSSQRFSMDISSSYVPVKINPAGVLPVMFADSMMVVPAIIMKLLGSWFNIQPGLLSDIIMLILKSILILFFCIFCLSFTMNPEDISDNLRSRNACVPYVYEGSRTSRFFEVILNRISAIGCIYMCFVAATPELLTILVPSLKGGIISGTSLLILIGISLEIYSRMAPEPRK